MRRHQPRRLTGLALVGALALGAPLAGCSDEAPDPAEARQERVETRLRDSFSAAQARCIVERLDPAAVRALDRTADLEAESVAMVAYSEAVTACVADPDAPPPETSTTAAPASTTTTEPG